MEDQCLAVHYESDFKNAGKGYSRQRDESEACELSQGLGEGVCTGRGLPVLVESGCI